MNNRELITTMLAAGLLFAAAFASTVGAAGDEGVYGPTAPPGSAFLRVFNATPQGTLEASVADKAITDIPEYGASEFIFLPPGSHTLSVAGKSENLKLDKNRYYTAALMPDGIRLLDNEPFKNRLKSRVILYNLTDSAALSLRASDGRTVIEPVAANGTGSREVNAVKVNLDLYDGDKKISTVRPVALERGKAFSLFATGSKSSPATVWAVN